MAKMAFEKGRVSNGKLNLKFEEKANKEASLECCFICFRNMDNDQRYKENQSCGPMIMETDTWNKVE